jgi:hypothetical protein
MIGASKAGHPARFLLCMCFPLPQAYELRRLLQQRYHITDHLEPLLLSLQQLASLADRAGKPAEALRFLEPLLSIMKEAGNGSGVTPAAVQVCSMCY